MPTQCLYFNPFIAIYLSFFLYLVAPTLTKEADPPAILNIGDTLTLVPMVTLGTPPGITLCLFILLILFIS